MENSLTFDISIDEMEIFLEDVNECLQAMENGLLHLEQQHDTETLNSIFRAAHTLKALAGTVGHHQMADLTHTLENIFDEMREAGLSPTQAVADELFAVVDVLRILRDEIVNRQAGGIDVAKLIARLRALKDGNEEQDYAPETSPLGPDWLTPEQALQVEDLSEAGQTILEIEVRTAAETFAPAARLYQVAIALMEAGQVVAQQPVLNALTDGDERMWLILATQSEPDDIKEILSEIEDLAEFDVQPYFLQSPLPEEQEKEVITPSPTLSIEKDRATVSGNSQVSGSSLIKAESTVRISVERLDTLMNLVGELVTNRTRLVQIEDMLRGQFGQEGEVGSLSEMVPHFSHVIDQLQEEVMRARMLPIASLFNKFPRLVRDVARIAGKKVKLVIEGEATELDRAIVHAIGDPLIHLLRNAVDHGLETPEARRAAGKSPTGSIRLTAASVEGQIVITIADDGQGINPGKIRQAALNHNLFSEEELAQLTEDEIIELIFQPNLSTAAKVTEMSGRGVGLDVVRTNVEKLSGSVVVTGKPGEGTTFQITLPLTLALVQTMLVTVHNNLYAVPVTSINGALYLSEATINTVKGKPALDWQGKATVPLLDLRQFFSRPHSTAKLSNGSKSSVVLVSWGKHRVGLVVDKIIGQQEIVVKSLSPLVGHIPGVSGATILGDGRIALIVDIPSLINAAIRAQRAV